jgi:hypothetical protein
MGFIFPLDRGSAHIDDQCGVRLIDGSVVMRCPVPRLRSQSHKSERKAVVIERNAMSR